MEDLAEKKSTWVLSRLHLQIKHLPMVYDRLTVLTWPRGVEGIFAMRDFEVQKPSYGTVLKASSAWLVIDPVSNRPKKFTDITSDIPNYRRAGFETLPTVKVPGSDSSQQNEDLVVRVSDLDMNMHVNNVRYVQWIMDDCYEIQSNGMVMSEIEINFMAECKMGDKVQVSTCGGDGSTYNHSVFRMTDGKEVCRARTNWVAFKQLS
jgi:acyl-ACP thioesterase